MAINIICRKCRSEMSTTTKICSKCNTPIPTKNKTYRVIVSHNGKRMTKVVNTLELARDIESKWQTDNIRNECGVQKNKKIITLNELWGQYLPFIKANKKTWIDDDLLYNKHFKDLWGDKPLDTILPNLIDVFMSKLKGSKSSRGISYSDSTQRHILVLLTRLFNIARKWSLFDGENPCNKISKPKVNNQITEFLTDDELQRLLAVLESWHNKMSVSFVLFLLYTGLRRGELFTLTWERVDIERQTILLKNPKGKVDQILPLSDKAIEVLKAIPKEFKTDYVFYGENGQKRKDFKGPWERIKKASKLPQHFRLHGLRHHFASTLVSNGVDLFTVQKLLCHKDSKMTQRYAHLADKTLRDAIALSDNMFEKK